MILDHHATRLTAEHGRDWSSGIARLGTALIRALRGRGHAGAGQRRRGDPGIESCT